MRSDPYAVWLSEIMLQQTTTVTVTTYYTKFLKKWPNVCELAAASLDEVLNVWQGLGYYTRARNLHKCARAIVMEHGGQFPDTENTLKRLPGIGDYTAAAIVAIAFGYKATPIDSNIERVVSRLHAIRKPLPGSKLLVRRYAEELTPNQRAGDFAQALMDLGATVCRPKSANCLACPLSKKCLASRESDPNRYPIKPKKKSLCTRYGVVFWTVREDGRVLVRRRPEHGLLGGMIEFPGTDWRDLIWEKDSWSGFAPKASSWRELPKPVFHTFSHFRLELRIKVGVAVNCKDNEYWCHPNNFSDLALPTVMKKVASIALNSHSS